MPDIVLAADWSANPLLKQPARTVFADTFNRADGSIIGSATPVGGLTWKKYASAAGATDVVIRSGAAGAIAPATTVLVVGYVTTDTPNGVITAVFGTGTGNTVNGFKFRFVDGNNFLEMSVISGLWWLRKRVAGDYVNVVSSGVAMAAGDVIEVTLEGTSVKVSINSIARISQTVTDHATATSIGIGGASGNPAVDPASTWESITYSVPGV